MMGTVKRIDLDDALRVVTGGGAFVDLRAVPEYLDAHIKGSLSLQYEFGPGMQQRARDCIPLDVPLVVLDQGEHDVTEVGAALRGKGFAVVGVVERGLDAWIEAHGAPATTPLIPESPKPEGTLLSVGDPGSLRLDDALFIPITELWARVDEVPTDERVTVVAGRGVRAALAVGILERAGIDDIAMWQSRPRRRSV